MDVDAQKLEASRKAFESARRPLQPRDQLKVSYGAASPSRQAAPRLAGSDIDSDLLPPRIVKGEHPYLDITRICCVWCVAVDHGNWTFGQWNCMFTQDWVLQYLFLVSGVGYGLSSRRLGGYLSRLSAYFVLGVLMNWSAAAIAGWNWKGNMFDVVFHLWFVVGLMIYAILLAPLKWYLQSTMEKASREGESSPRAAAERESVPEADHPEVESPQQAPAEAQENSLQQVRDSVLWAMMVIGGGLVCIFFFFLVVMRPVVQLLAAGAGSSLSVFGQGADFWGLPQDYAEAKIFFQRLLTYLMCTCTNIYFMVVCPHVLKEASTTTWLVIVNTYVHKLFFYRAQDDRMLHGLDLMLMGMSCYYFGLRHRQLIGRYVVRYWFAVLLVGALLWPPGAHQRFDEVPPGPQDTEQRIRVYLLEAIFVVIWLAAGERLVQPEIFTEDKLKFLNNWGMLTFLVHKAVHIAVVPPLNWAFLVLLAPACYLVEHSFRGFK